MTRSQPWEGLSNVAIIYQVAVLRARNPIPPPPERAGGDGSGVSSGVSGSSCPVRLAALIERCWATEPRSRPACTEVVAELEVILLEETQRRKLERSLAGSAESLGREAIKAHSIPINSGLSLVSSSGAPLMRPSSSVPIPMIGEPSSPRGLMGGSRKQTVGSDGGRLPVILADVCCATGRSNDGTGVGWDSSVLSQSPDVHHQESAPAQTHSLSAPTPEAATSLIEVVQLPGANPPDVLLVEDGR